MAANLFFSIIIPTYNRASYIKKTIYSVLEQTYTHFEIIIVDDGSKDNTEEKVKEINDPRIRYFYQNNRERAAARNLGVSKAKGDYITFLDSDDLMYKDCLQEACTFLENKVFPPFLHTAYEIKDSKGEVIKNVSKRKGDLNEQLIYGNSLSCIGIFVQKEILLEFPFNEDRRLSGSEDYELWLKLACRYPFSYSNKITSALIQHQERSVLGFESNQLIQRVTLLIKYILEDKAFREKFGREQDIFIAHRYLYLSLHLIMNREVVLGLKYWVRSVLHLPMVLLHIKTLGIIKNCFKAL